MIGNRPSILDTTRFCGLAGRLAKQHSEGGRSALMSKAKHALEANAPEAETLFRQLTRDEQSEVASWPSVGDVRLPGGPVLRYQDAEKELLVGLSKDYEYCRVDDPECLTGGTLDMAWEFDPSEFEDWQSIEGVIVCVADIKRTRWTTIEGPDSLQLKAYALALCARENAAGYFTGLWIAEEGIWDWSREVVLLGTRRAMQDIREVTVAAQNLGEGVTGEHCRHCYNRLYCPTWASPPTNHGALDAGLDPKRLTHENASAAILEAQRLKDLAERVIENAKAFTEVHGPIVDQDTGRVYEGSLCKGKRSVSIKGLQEQMGKADAEQYISMGSPYKRYTWNKGRK